MSVKYKTSYRPSMGELERRRKEEIDKRRKLRLVQVREQAKNNAAIIRERVRLKKEEVVNKLATKIQRKMIEANGEEIKELEEKYNAALNEMGHAHDTAICWVDPSIDQAFQSERNQAVAEDRYNLALDKLRDDEYQKKAKYSAWLEAKTSTLEAERKRSQLVSRLPKPEPPPYNLNPPDHKDSVNVRVFDQKAVSTTHVRAEDMTCIKRELTDSDKENDKHTNSPNAREKADIEWQKISEINKMRTVKDEEYKVKAQLRGREAGKKEMVKQTYEKMMSELENLHRGDLARRQRAYNSIPKQIFAVPNSLREESRSLERRREKAFETIVIDAAESTNHGMMEKMRLIGPVPASSHDDSGKDASLTHVPDVPASGADEPASLRGYRLYSAREDLPRSRTDVHVRRSFDDKTMKDSGIAPDKSTLKNSDMDQEKDSNLIRHPIEEALVDEDAIVKEKTAPNNNVLDRLFQRIKRQRFNWLVKGRSDDTEEAEKEILSARLCSDVSEIEKEESEMPEKETRRTIDSQINDFSLDRTSEDKVLSSESGGRNVESEAEMRTRLVDRLLSRAEIERENQKLEEENKYLDSRIESIRQRGVIPPPPVTVSAGDLSRQFHHVRQTININGRVSEYQTLPMHRDLPDSTHQNKMSLRASENKDEADEIQHSRSRYHQGKVDCTIIQPHEGKRRKDHKSDGNESGRNSPHSQVSATSSISLSRVRAFQKQALSKLKHPGCVDASGDTKDVDDNAIIHDRVEEQASDIHEGHIKKVGGAVVRLTDMKLQSVHDKMSRITSSEISDENVIEETKKRLSSRQTSLEAEKERLFQRYMTIRLGHDMGLENSSMATQSVSPWTHEENVKPSTYHFPTNEDKHIDEGDDNRLDKQFPVSDKCSEVVSTSNSVTPRNQKRRRRKKVKMPGSKTRWKYTRSIIEARSKLESDDEEEVKSSDSEQRFHHSSRREDKTYKINANLRDTLLKEDKQPADFKHREDSSRNWSSDINDCIKSLIELSASNDNQKDSNPSQIIIDKSHQTIATNSSIDAKSTERPFFESDLVIHESNAPKLFEIQQSTSPPPDIRLDPNDLSAPSFTTDATSESNHSLPGLFESEELMQDFQPIDLDSQKRHSRPTRPPVSSSRHFVGTSDLVRDFIPHELSQIQESLLQSNSSIAQPANQLSSTDHLHISKPITEEVLCEKSEEIKNKEIKDNLECTLTEQIGEHSPGHPTTPQQSLSISGHQSTPSFNNQSVGGNLSNESGHISQFSACSSTLQDAPTDYDSTKSRSYHPLSSSPQNDKQPPPSFAPPPISSISSGSRSSSMKSMKEEIMTKYFQEKLLSLREKTTSENRHENVPTVIELEEKKDGSKEDLVKSSTLKSQSTAIKGGSSSSNSISLTQRQNLPPCPSPFVRLSKHVDGSPNQVLEISQFTADSLSLSQSIIHNDQSDSNNQHWYLLNQYSSTSSSNRPSFASDSLKVVSPHQSDKISISQYPASSTNDPHQSNIKDISQHQAFSSESASVNNAAQNDDSNDVTQYKASSCDTTSGRTDNHQVSQYPASIGTSSGRQATSVCDSVSKEITQHKVFSSTSQCSSMNSRQMSQYPASSSSSNKSEGNSKLGDDCSLNSKEKSIEELPTLIEKLSVHEIYDRASDNTRDKNDSNVEPLFVRRSLQELSRHSPSYMGHQLSTSLLSFQKHELSCSEDNLTDELNKQHASSEYDLHHLARLKVTASENKVATKSSILKSSNARILGLRAHEELTEECAEKPGPTGDRKSYSNYSRSNLTKGETYSEPETKEKIEQVLKEWQNQRLQNNQFTNSEFIETIKSALDKELSHPTDNNSPLSSNANSNPTPVVPRLNLEGITTPSGCSSNATSSRRAGIAAAASHSTQDSGVTSSRTIDSEERKRLAKESLNRTKRLWNQLEEVKEKRQKEDREKRNKEFRERAKKFTEKHRENWRKGGKS